MMKDEPKETSPRWIIAVIAAALLAIAALTYYDTHEVIEIDLSERVDDTELARMVPDRDSSILRFGFDLRSLPDEDARQYLPFLKYMEEATGLRFELRFTPRNSSIMEEFGKGRLDFAAVGAQTYIQARERLGVIPLVHGLNAEGRAEYQSVIVVAPGSPIRSIEDLRGKSFAFGCVTSTQGHLIPRIILAEHGMSLDDLAAYEYTGSHRNCGHAVATGRFEAGGMQDILGRRMAAEGLVRIIHSSRFYPSSGIAASRDVPPDVMRLVRRALLDFDPARAHAEGLYHWDRTEMAGGFKEARAEDFAKLREWSIEFGLLDAPTGKEAR